MIEAEASSGPQSTPRVTSTSQYNVCLYTYRMLEQTNQRPNNKGVLVKPQDFLSRSVPICLSVSLSLSLSPYFHSLTCKDYTR